MLTVLLESRAARSRHLGGTLFSTLAHGAVIATVVALTLPGRSARSTPDVHPTTVTFVRTPRPTGTPSHSTATSPPAADAPPRPDLRTIVIPVTTPTSVPPIDVSLPSTSSDQILIGGSGNSLTSGSATLGSTVSGAGGVSGVSDVSDVDRAPRILGRAPEPRYPATLRAAGIEGHVLAEFVVDTLGRAELASLRFPELANPLFGDAVREALTHYRFTPGEVAGHRVRTRVAVPFEFRLER